MALASASRERRPRSLSPARFARAKPSKPFAYLELGHLCSTQSSAIVCVSVPLLSFSPSPFAFPNHDKTDFLLFLLGRLPAAAAPGAPGFQCAPDFTLEKRSRELARKRARLFWSWAETSAAARPPSFGARAMLPLNLLKAAQGHPMVSQEIRARGHAPHHPPSPSARAPRERRREDKEVPESASCARPVASLASLRRDNARRPRPPTPSSSPSPPPRWRERSLTFSPARSQSISNS